MKFISTIKSLVRPASATSLLLCLTATSAYAAPLKVLVVTEDKAYSRAVSISDEYTSQGYTVESVYPNEVGSTYLDDYAFIFDLNIAHKESGYYTTSAGDFSKYTDYLNNNNSGLILVVENPGLESKGINARNGAVIDWLNMFGAGDVALLPYVTEMQNGIGISLPNIFGKDQHEINFKWSGLFTGRDKEISFSIPVINLQNLFNPGSAPAQTEIGVAWSGLFKNADKNVTFKSNLPLDSEADTATAAQEVVLGQPGFFTDPGTGEFILQNEEKEIVRSAGIMFKPGTLNYIDKGTVIVISDVELFDATPEKAQVFGKLGELTLGDSDGDLVPDAIENNQGTDPLVAGSFLDTDSDGIPDYVEEKVFYPATNIWLDQGNLLEYYNLLAESPDTDLDGVPDLIEEIQSTNPADELDFLDSDLGGESDYSELLNGRDTQDGLDDVSSNQDLTEKPVIDNGGSTAGNTTSGGSKSGSTTPMILSILVLLGFTRFRRK